MKISVNDKKTYSVLALSGEFDNEYDHNDFLARVTKLAADGKQNILIDLAGTSFLCSADISVIMQAYKIVTDKKGKFAICNCNVAISRVFRITKISSIIGFFSNEDGAKKFFESKEAK